MEEFPRTPATAITRLAKRGSYDKSTVYNILDAALFCTIGFTHEGRTIQIPTGFCRLDDVLYIHGSVGSSWMRMLAAHKPEVSLSVTHLDGLVLARSAFHHSVNYRSVSIFSRPELVRDTADLDHILEVFTEKMCPGRWNDIRKPTANEWKETMVLKLPIEEAVAKVRTGPPKDDQEDYDGPWWAGVLPMKITKGKPEADPLLKSGVEIPEYLASQ